MKRAPQPNGAHRLLGTGLVYRLAGRLGLFLLPLPRPVGWHVPGMRAVAFLEALTAAVPYRIHAALTDQPAILSAAQMG